LLEVVVELQMVPLAVVVLVNQGLLEEEVEDHLDVVLVEQEQLTLVVAVEQEQDQMVILQVVLVVQV
jgi:hypothetical protein